jgi:ABC-type multidrug transport system ATPase subunit
LHKKADLPIFVEKTGLMESPVITAEHLTREFPEGAGLVDVSFEVTRGSLFAYIGTSGSGKSTLARLLTGSYEPTQGAVLVLGESPARFSDRARRKIGYVPQNNSWYGHLTVRENLNFSGSLYGVSPFRRKRLRAILEFLGLEEARNEFAANLPQDLQRRLSLAVSLVHDPELLILDEPASGLPASSAEQFWFYLRQLRSEGKTVFVTTQNVADAACCDQIAVSVAGRLLTVDSPDGLCRRAFGGEMLDIVSDCFDISRHLQPLMELPFVKGKPRLLQDGRIRVIVDDAKHAIDNLTDWCSERNIPINAFERFVPGFEAAYSKFCQASHV